MSKYTTAAAPRVLRPLPPSSATVIGECAFKIARHLHSHQLVLRVVGEIPLPAGRLAVIRQVAVVVVGKTAARTAAVLVLAVHRERVRPGVVGPFAQVPRRVVQVTAVFARHSAVAPLQLGNVVVSVRVIAPIGAGEPDALVAGVVKVLALVQNAVRAVLQVRSGEAGNVVVCVGDVGGIREREFDWQADSLPHLVVISESARGRRLGAQPVRRVPGVSVGPTAGRLSQAQAGPEPVVVCVTHGIAAPRAVFGVQQTARVIRIFRRPDRVNHGEPVQGVMLQRELPNSRTDAWSTRRQPSW